MSTDAASTLPPLAVDPALLPDDPAVLKELIAQLMELIQKRDGRVEQLEHQMTLLLRRLYGIKSEKVDPRQGILFDEPAEETPPATNDLRTNRLPTTSPTVSRASSPNRRRVHHGPVRMAVAACPIPWSAWNRFTT